MKIIVLLLSIALSNSILSFEFPQNIEHDAGLLLLAELSKDKSLASVEIDKISFLDMDSHAEYYLQGIWKQELLTGIKQICTSEIYYSRSSTHENQFLLLTKTCN